MQMRAVVTGASRGIGRALALALAEGGAIVGGTFRGPAADRAAFEAEIEARGGVPFLRAVDTSQHSQVQSFGDEFASLFGGIDVWVNNAARLLVQPFLETSEANWKDLFDTNFLGYVWGCQVAARHMLEHRSGRIINVGSVVLDQPPTEMTAYVSAKGAVLGLTRALAVELGPAGISVIAVAPGATETPLNQESWTPEVRRRYAEQIPLSRIAQSEDIADAIALLAQPGARYITGELIRIDGGLIRNGTVGHDTTN